MYIGITVDKFKKLKISDVLKITSMLGLQYVELTESVLNEDIDQLSSLLDSTRTGFHLPNEGDNGYDFSCRSYDQKIESVINLVNTYKEKLNIEYCITHPPECHPENFSQAERIDTLLKNLSRLDCPLIIENIPSLSIDEFDHFYDLAKTTLKDKILGICFDAPRAFIRGDDPIDMIHHLDGSIYSVHLSDCKKRHDLHLPFGLGGDLPIDAILKELKKKGYEGNINLELMPRSLSDVTAVIDSYLKILRIFKIQKYRMTKFKVMLIRPFLKLYLSN